MTGRPVTAPPSRPPITTFSSRLLPPVPPPPASSPTESQAAERDRSNQTEPNPPPAPAMSEGPARSSTESSSAASSGLDFEDTALTLRLPGSDPDRKRAASTSSPSGGSPRASEAPPAPKAQVVGWPPVSRNRRNALPRGKFVKVAVAGAPYQRKVDLEAYAGYDQLLAALQDKFTSHFTVRRRVGNDEMALVDVVSGAEYVPTYEDKDGDWMLVGDVPWRMFVETCQRLRLMKSSEVVNLAPRAAE